MAKKKILILFVAAALLLTACDSGSSVTFTKKWNTSFEQISYEVSIKTSGGTEIATGKADTKIVKVTVDGKDFWKYTAENEYVFTGGAAEYTDKIESECRFDFNTLAPVYSYRKVTLANRIEDGNDSDEQSRKNQSYEIEATYGGGKVTGTATFTHKEAFKYSNDAQIEDGEFSFNLPSGKYYDSEQIYILLRCIDGMSAGFTGHANVINLLDSVINKSLSGPQFKLAAESNTTVAAIPQKVADFIEVKSLDRECLNASISLNSEQSGPAISVLLSKDGFRTGGLTNADVNELVPIKIISQNSGQFFINGVFYDTTITYSLSDYSFDNING